MTCASPSVSVRRSLRRWLARELWALSPTIAAATTRYQADRYRKHFTTWQHCCVLLAHGLSGSPSLRETHRSFADLGGIATMSGLLVDGETIGVSYPQLAASTTTRPAAVLGAQLAPLLRRAAGVLHLPGIPPDLLILDSTRLPLSLLHAPWLTWSKGVQLQVLYQPADACPLAVVVPEDVRCRDYQGMDRVLLTQHTRLAALTGQTVVVDRGYYSTVRFQALLDAGIHVLTRRHPQAHIVVERDYPIQDALPLADTRITILTDQRITLGHPTHHKVRPLQNWRMVTATVQPLPKAAKRGATPVVYQVLTDRWDLTASQVICGYLWRWQIELFFRWLKRQIRLIHLLGYSENAVLVSVWLSLLVHLLLVLATALLGRQRPSVTVYSALAAAIAHLDLAALHPAILSTAPL